MRHWALVLCVGLALGSCGTSGASSNGKGGAGGSGSSTGTGGATATGGATGTGGATATGGSAVSLTCGNGNLDSGEDCDGSQLGGKTCTSLGFNGGTLACTSICRYDTSGCSGSLTPVITSSRTSCAAPCEVFFDATKTTGLMASDYVNANFAWSFDTANVDPNGAHPQAIGFGVGHVFETPGTYQVALVARDSAGHAGSATVSINVSAMSGPTYYVASTGNDKNAGTTTAKPLATYAAAMAKQAAQVSVLFRRGDTFNTGSAELDISGTGPFLIGAYSDPASPSTAAPILKSSIGGGTTGIMRVTSATDIRVLDLHLLSNDASGGLVADTATDTLVERVEMEQLGQGSTTPTQVVYVDNTDTRTFFVDCHLHDFVAYGFYLLKVDHLAIVGTTIDKFTGGQHGIREQGGSFSFIASNTITSVDTPSPALSGITIRGDNQNSVVVNNRSNRLIEFTPQNTSVVEHVTYGLAEGNLVNDNRSPPAFPSMNVTAQHIVIRNNIFVNATAAIAITSMPLLPKNFVDQIFVYNNTAYFFPTSYNVNYGANLVTVEGTTGAATVENNIFAHGLTLTNEQMNFVYSDGLGTVTEDHNFGYDPNGKGTWQPGTGAGDKVGNPMFVSTDATGATPFQLGAGSAAIDVGAAVPVYQDFAGAPRPAGAGWDVGAFEFQSP